MCVKTIGYAFAFCLHIKICHLFGIKQGKENKVQHSRFLCAVCSGGGLAAKSFLTLATPWPVAHQAPLSREFCRQEYWSGCFSLLQGMFLTQGSNLCLLHCRQILYLLSYQLKPLLAFTFSHLECKLHFGKHLLYSLMFLRHLEWCLTLSRYSVNIF